jgi:hypothetical protein
VRISANRATLGAARLGLLVIGFAVLAACNRPASGPRAADAATTQGASLSPRADGLTPEARQQLAELRAMTAPYREVAAAKAAGFIELTGCMSDPVKGGMGVLYGMTSRFDGKPEPNAPETLVYAPGDDGKLRLVAAEYAVPFGAWPSPNPPELFGQPFHKDVVFGLWVLHAWIGKANPSGVFAEYNPLVVCENA